MIHPSWRAVAFAMSLALLSASPRAETVLRMDSFIPPTSLSVTHVLAPYAAAVEKDAGGDLRIQAFWGGALGRDPFKQYALLTDGVIDIGFVQAVFSAGQFPDEVLFERPYIVRTAKEASVAKIIKHVTEMPLGLFNTSFFLAANPPKWEQISPADRAAVMRISGAPMITGCDDRTGPLACGGRAAGGSETRPYAPEPVAVLRDKHLILHDAEQRAVLLVGVGLRPARLTAASDPVWPSVGNTLKRPDAFRVRHEVRS